MEPTRLSAASPAIPFKQPPGSPARAQARVARILASMPPVRAMALELVGFDGRSLRLSAPLSVNVNDKGCAFAGSLSGLMTLACWSLCAVQLDLRGWQPDIYVQDSSVRYLAPLFDDLLAEARPDQATDWDAMATALAGRGRARARLQAVVRLPDGQPAATLEGRFVAIASP